MGCHSCGNLDAKKKSKGKASGALYFCKKNKSFVNPTSKGCKNYKKCSRKPWENDEIYNDGKLYFNDIIPAIVYIIIFFILIIIGLLSGVFF